jgi:sterol desaturase/sphingolipid hydroxylase (fatty acid hydroxylase superfamily)
VTDRAFHKKHHEFVGTISIAAENAHPVENLIANFAPSLLFELTSGPHPFQFYTRLAWILSMTYETHSGFCFYGTYVCALLFLFNLFL